MLSFPNAKINIGLTVGKQREDGYHNIFSHFYPIPLCDILEVMPAHSFHFQSSGIPLDDKDNSVIQAYKLLQNRFDIQPVFIHLHKQIPIGAGLGGGSSDAVACLKSINHLFDLNLNTQQLQDLALELGSDCPFFVENRAVHVSGRGEMFNACHINLKGKYLKLVYPDIRISTAEAFAGLETKKTEQNGQINLEHNIVNDFEDWAFKKHPELSALKDQLSKENAIINASMTGTGSAIYGIYDEKPKKTTHCEFEKIFLLE